VNATRADEFQTTVPHWGQLARAYAALGQNAKMTEAVGIRASIQRFPKTLPIWVDGFFKHLIGIVIYYDAIKSSALCKLWTG
jgi:hypothetical protein